MNSKPSDAPRPTINAIAQRAGVSRGTVDRVLNGRPGVKPESRALVLEAAREMRYISKRLEKLSALGESPRAKTCRLGVLIPCYASSDFEEKAVAGIEDAKRMLSSSGAEVIVERCETQLVDESLERLDALARSPVAGIAMTAVNVERVERKIDELARMGIPVITYNSDIPRSKRVCFVGEDAYLSGRIAGNLFSMIAPGEGNILALVGNKSFDSHHLRLTGFMDYMAERGVSAEHIQVVQTYNDYMTSFELVKQALETDPGISGVYLANESVAGCAEAVSRLGLSGKIRIVCHDLSPVSRRLLKQGVVDFVITQDMYQQGYQPLTLLNDYVLRGKSGPINYTAPPAQILCRESLGE